MESYKKELEQLHASPELIESTLQLMKQEKVRIDQEKKARTKKNIVKLTTAVASMAAVAAIAIAVTQNANHLVYQEMPETEIRTTIENKEESTMSVGEYSDYLGIPFASLISNELPVRTEIAVTFAEDSDQVQSDRAVLTYNLDGKQVYVTLSGTSEVASEDLLEGKSNEIKGNEVYLGNTTDESKMYAAGTRNDISYQIQANDMSKKQFEKLVKDFLKNLETFE